MKKIISLLALVLVYIILMFSGCSKNEPTPADPNTQSDAYPPGYVWPAGDYPSLTAPPQITDNVTIGDPIRAYTVENDGNFNPTLKAIRSRNWIVTIIRKESIQCWTGYGWQFDNYLEWSYEIPVMTYLFEWPPFPQLCWNNDDSYVDKGGQDFWPQTQTHTFPLMQNGEWITEPREFYLYDQNWSGYSYDVTVSFVLPLYYLTELYVSMVRTWVVGQKAEDDVVRTEGEAEVTVHKVRGVEISNTNEFTQTLGLEAGVKIEVISASLNATFSSRTNHSVNLRELEETTEIRRFNVPANEQWRYITIYGVERYLFTDVNGNAWTGVDIMDLMYLGKVDNNVRTFLMIVKYNAGSDRPYTSELIDVTTD